MNTSISFRRFFLTRAWVIGGIFTALWLIDFPEVKAGEKRPMIEVETQFIRTTDEVMRQALKTPPNEKMLIGTSVLTPEQLDQTLAALKAAKVEFYSAPRAIAMNGQRAVIQSVRELPYPSAFEKLQDQPGKFFPTAFVTRNVGMTLEFEAVVGSENQIEITLSPSIVNFLGFIDYTNDQSQTGRDSSSLVELLQEPLKAGGIWKPVFTEQKISTSVRLFSGNTILLGSMPPAQVEMPEKESPKKPTNPVSLTAPLNTFIFVSARVLSE